MYANKRLGQHFLHDPAVIARILAAIDAQPGEHIVEIGPGRGALTAGLAASGVRLTVIERDRTLATELAARPDLAAAEVLQANALKVDYAALAADGPIRIVGNLPYNISTPLLFRFLEAAPRIRDMTFMLQREVVERMAAQPDTRAYGRLTVMLAARCRVEKLFTVGAGAFNPPPKVESAVVRLVPHAEPPFDPGDWNLFEQLVRAGFTARRKTLRNALRALTGATTIEAAGLDPCARPDTLAPADYARLAKTLDITPPPSKP
ncbi:MAG: 16S rRNA (adenine(1518)-N(6)/adenine(1519)-N(6))-dimethyltransferase RsmA [Gammaproteobacteria bacterium]